MSAPCSLWLQGVTSAITSLRAAGGLLGECAAGEATVLRTDIDEALAEALAMAGDYEQLGLLVPDLLGRLDTTGADRRRAACILLRAARTRPQDYRDMAAAHIAEARTLAGPLNDPELTGWIDVTIARNALVGGEVGQAGQLARQALAAAEEAGLTGWAAEVAVESLIVIAHQHRVSDPSSARAAFERAHTIADGQDLGAARIRTLHGLATIDMLAGGGARALADVRRLADDAGLPSITAIIDLQLADILSLGTDPNQALDAAVHCEQDARRSNGRRHEASAISHQALVHGIRGDIKNATQAARRGAEFRDTVPLGLLVDRLDPLARSGQAESDRSTLAVTPTLSLAAQPPWRQRRFS